MTPFFLMKNVFRSALASLVLVGFAYGGLTEGAHSAHAQQVSCREGGDIGLFITLVPKVLLCHFLIRWLNNFGELY